MVFLNFEVWVRDWEVFDLKFRFLVKNYVYDMCRTCSPPRGFPVYDDFSYQYKIEVPKSGKRLEKF